MVVFTKLGNVICKSILRNIHYPFFVMIVVAVIYLPLLSGCNSETPVKQYNLTINVDGNGTSVGGDAYDENTVVSVSASPDPGWEFVEWTGDIETLGDRLSSSTTIVMDSDYTITARFRLEIITPTNISNLVFDPTWPETLNYGEQVTFEFDYYLDERFPMYINSHPFSGDNITPNYLASGKTLYDWFKGRGSGSFTVNPQTGPIVVDQIRFQIIPIYENIILYEFFFPVNFTFQ